MNLTKTEATIVTSLLAVTTYLQSELNLSHGVHVAIGAAAIFFAGLGIKVSEKSGEV